MKRPELQLIKDRMILLGMTVFTQPFDMTMGGIRTKDNEANTFNDWLFMMSHDDEGSLFGVIEKGTTDAGLYYRLNPMNVDGTAIIEHGVQHRGAYEYQNPKEDGKRGHRNQEAFRQVASMSYWRDADRDKYLEFDGETETGNFYTNGHDMGTVGKNVDKWSAGCWGSVEKSMHKFFGLARLQIYMKHGTKFSFALLHETNFE
jgi:hypothetical protein